MAENTNIPTESAFVNTIKQHIITHYEPIDFASASLRLSNDELFEFIIRAFPNYELLFKGYALEATMFSKA